MTPGGARGALPPVDCFEVKRPPGEVAPVFPPPSEGMVSTRPLVLRRTMFSIVFEYLPFVEYNNMNIEHLQANQEIN